ncbi:cell envelope integrity protein CreD [Mucilaginibacter koreensis]
METEYQQTPTAGKNAVIIKLAIITALILLLLIPSSWIQSMITEREYALQTTQNSTANKWSKAQTFMGPVLVVPYTHTDGKNGLITQNLYLLPENLSINAKVKTEIFHRGVMDATVYQSKIQVSGNFIRSALTQNGIKPEDLQTGKAYITFGLSDLKGLKSNPVIHLKGQSVNVQPVFGEQALFNNGLQANITLPDTDNFNFNFTLDLNGSEALNFLHTGKTTDVVVTSDWKSPTYSGNYLPDRHSADTSGSSAHWRALYYNRPFPQQWTGNEALLSNEKAVNEATFGVKFQLPVDQYRKTMRTTKYSSLIILLTFVSLFLTELIRKQNIHVFNYILIGAAMVIYYTLLLSFAEHIGYDWAYLVSSVATISLIAWFTSSLMHNRSVALLFGLILTFFYGFIYVIIQLEELSLLIGSIALFFIVATLMYFSRKINWDKH